MVVSLSFLRQFLRFRLPSLFLLFLFLGICGTNNGAGLRAMLGTNYPSIWDKSPVNLGQIHGELGTNSPSQLGTSDKECPKQLWISQKTIVLQEFVIRGLGQIPRHGYG
jgi:hypothetical protein